MAILVLPLLLLWWTFKVLFVVAVLLLRVALFGIRYGIAAHQQRQLRKAWVPF